MSSFVGVWLLLRGLSLFGAPFVRGVVPGIAGASLFDFSTFLSACLVSSVMVSVIERVTGTASMTEVSSIVLLFVVMMALGVVLISGAASFQRSLTAVLFGHA